MVAAVLGALSYTGLARVFRWRGHGYHRGSNLTPRSPLRPTERRTRLTERGRRGVVGCRSSRSPACDARPIGQRDHRRQERVSVGRRTATARGDLVW
jgi:hypothetical protein